MSQLAPVVSEPTGALGGTAFRGSPRTAREGHARPSRLGQLVGPAEQALEEAQALRTLPSASPNQPPIDFEVWRLHVRYQRTRNRGVRAELVEIYRGYAAALARRMHRDHEPLEDLVQVAMEALIRSVERFDVERGVPFPAFAAPTITGALKRHYRDLGWSVRVTRRIHEIASPVRDAADRLTVELGRSPTVAEVARDLNLSEEQVLEAQEAMYVRSVQSLDERRGADGSQFDVIGSLDPELARSDNHLSLAKSLAELEPDERELLRLYYVDELTQSEIAGRLGVSQMQVSRLLAATLRRLRSRMG